MDKISIIVSIYNVSNYLKECIINNIDSTNILFNEKIYNDIIKQLLIKWLLIFLLYKTNV